MAHEALADHIATLFNNSDFSDVIIRCDDRQWYAHINIISQSAYFEKVFFEAQTGYIDLEDDDPLVVDALLMYLYTGDYSYKAITQDGKSSLVFNVQVFALAEKFMVPALLNFAAQKFEVVLQEGWDEDVFADAIVEWTGTTTDPHEILGDVILETIVDRREELFQPGKKSSLFRHALNAAPWLSGEIANMLMSSMDCSDAGTTTLYRCPNHACQAMFQASMIPGMKFKLSCQQCRRVADMKWSTWRKYVVKGQQC